MKKYYFLHAVISLMKEDFDSEEEYLEERDFLLKEGDNFYLKKEMHCVGNLFSGVIIVKDTELSGCVSNAKSVAEITGVLKDDSLSFSGKFYFKEDVFKENPEVVSEISYSLQKKHENHFVGTGTYTSKYSSVKNLHISLILSETPKEFLFYYS